jgi:hypothetical protein
MWTIGNAAFGTKPAHHFLIAFSLARKGCARIFAWSDSRQVRQTSVQL